MVFILKSRTTEVLQMIRAPKHTCPFMPSYVTEQSGLEGPTGWWEAAAHLPTSPEGWRQAGGRTVLTEGVRTAAQNEQWEQPPPGRAPFTHNLRDICEGGSCWDTRLQE